MDEAQRTAIREREEKASAMVAALCLPRGHQDTREWVMSIPARPDHDPDLVIGASLMDIPALLKEIDRLTELLTAGRKGE
jgi:hypothetical protein